MRIRLPWMATKRFTFTFALALFVSTANSALAGNITINLAGPSFDWNPIMQGATFDLVGDPQANAGITDLVGDANHAVLYTLYDDQGTADKADDELAYRLRLGASSESAYSTIGIDANADGKLDVFVVADGKNNNGVRFFSPGNDENISPNTTSMEPITTVVADVNHGYTEYSYTADNHSFAAVSSIDNQNDNGGTLTSDIGSTNGDDYFVSFKFPFIALKKNLEKLGLTLTKSTSMQYLVFTATQDNSINGDLSGLGKKSAGNWGKTFAESGVITPPLSADGQLSFSLSGLLSEYTILDGGTFSEVVSVEGAPNGVLSWSLGGIDSGEFTLVGDNNSGSLNLSSRDVSSPTDSDGNNSYLVTITATDASGYIINKDIAVLVSSLSITGVASRYSIDEGASFTAGTPTLNGASGNKTWDISGDDSARFSVNNAGVLTMDAKDYESPEDLDVNNTYLVTLKGSNSGDTVSQLVTVVVNDVSDKITVTPQNSVVVGTAVTASYTPVAGSDGQVYQWQSLEGATWAEIADANSLNYTTEASNLGKFIRVRVTDTINASGQTPAIVEIETSNEVEVIAAPQPPVMPANGAITKDENIATSSVLVNVNDTNSGNDTDGDGDTILYTLSGADKDYFSINSAGELVFSSSPDYEHKTGYTVTVVGTSIDGNDSVDYTINLTNLNDNTPSGTVSISPTNSSDAGTKLTASHNLTDGDGPSPLVVSYQWQLDDGSGWGDITGAASFEYTTITSDGGKLVRVLASYTDNANASERSGSASVEVNASGAEIGTLDTKHYIPPIYARSSLSTANDVRDHYLYLSTLESTAFDVNITNSDGSVNQTVSVSKSSPTLVTLSDSPYGSANYGALNIVTKAGANSVNKNDGLVLTAGKRFYANIRHASGAQGGSLVSKGQTAIGNRFRSGHVYTNTQQLAVKSHFISVMAMEDGTTVTFADISPGITFVDETPSTITLNQYESFVVAMELDAGSNSSVPNDLNGTLVTADKAIVMNSGSFLAGHSSDSGSGRDIGIDQVVPTAYLGTRFIPVEGDGGTNVEKMEVPIVIADSDDTQIYINGSTSAIATINAGDYYPISGSNYQNGTMFIRTSQPAYLYQSTSSNNNNGQAMNFVAAIFDNLESQDLLVPAVNQLGTPTISIVAPSSATVTVDANALSSGKAVPGIGGFVLYTINGKTGDVEVSSTEPYSFTMTSEEGARGASAFYVGFPNSFAINDNVTTQAQTAIAIDVLANDVKGNNNFTVSPTLTVNPASGSAVINANGTITYTPNVGFTSDTFSYKISSGSGINDIAVVTIKLDTDGDKVADTEDADSDNDGIPDATEVANSPASNDTDGDGIEDKFDLDSDNDGIFDLVEAGHSAIDANGDGRIDDSVFVGDNGLADILETVAESGVISYTLATTDADGLPNYLDLDSDGDGLPDNVEAQVAASYIAPNGIYDALVGTDTAYPTGLTPVNTLSGTSADYINTNSDGDSASDTVEAGLTLSGSVGSNGLHDSLESSDNYSDSNGSLDNPATLPDGDADNLPNFRDNDSSPEISGGGAISLNLNENITAVTTITATDADTDDGFLIFSLNGTDKDKFNISSDGVLTLKSAADYEDATNADHAYVVEVQVSDGVNLDSQTVTVNINNVNEHSVDGVASISPLGVNPKGTQLSASLINAGNSDGINASRSYQWQSKTAGGVWSNIAGASNQTYTTTADDADKSIQVAISYGDLSTVSGAGGTAGAGGTVIGSGASVIDRAPELGNASATLTPNENTATSVVLKNLNDSSGNDTDADGDVIQYSVSDTTNFKISVAGELSFKLVPDYENQTSYSVTVTGTSMGGQDTVVYTVSLNNLDDNAPTGAISITPVGPINKNIKLTSTINPAISDADGPGTLVLSYQWQSKRHSGC